MQYRRVFVKNGCYFFTVVTEKRRRILQCQADAKNDASIQEGLKVAEQQAAYKPHADSQQILIAGLFNKTTILDVIQNFTVFEPSGSKVIKKI